MRFTKYLRLSYCAEAMQSLVAGCDLSLVPGEDMTFFPGKRPGAVKLESRWGVSLDRETNLYLSEPLPTTRNSPGDLKALISPFLS